MLHSWRHLQGCMKKEVQLMEVVLYFIYHSWKHHFPTSQQTAVLLATRKKYYAELKGCGAAFSNASEQICDKIAKVGSEFISDWKEKKSLHKTRGQCTHSKIDLGFNKLEVSPTFFRLYRSEQWNKTVPSPPWIKALMNFNWTVKVRMSGCLSSFFLSAIHALCNFNSQDSSFPMWNTGIK